MRSVETKYTPEQLKELAVKEEKRSAVRREYPNVSLHPDDLDKIVSLRSLPVPQNWKTFIINDLVDLGNDVTATVVGITPKDIVLDFSEAPPVELKQVVEINKHKFRVRKVKGTLATIRPLLGTSRQYV